MKVWTFETVWLRPPLVLADELVDAGQGLGGLRHGVPRAVDEVLELRPLGIDRRHLLLGRRLQGRGTGASAIELDIGAAGQALELHARPRVDLDGGQLLDGHDGNDAGGVVGQKVKRVDLPDPDAVEKHAGANRQAGDRAGEDDLIAGDLRPFGKAREPYDEPKRGADHRQGEQPNQGIVGTRFHVRPSRRRVRPWRVAHGNRPSARGDSRRAWSPSCRLR